MKKFWIICMSLLMSVALCFGIVGCKNDKDNETETATISVTVNGNAQTNGGTYNAVVGTAYTVAATSSNEAAVSVSYVFGSKTTELTGTAFTPAEAGSYVFTFTAENAESFKLTIAAKAQSTPATKYTLTYALGDHAASDAKVVDAAEYEEGASVTLSAGPNAAEGYIFVGWSDGTTTHDAGAIYTVNGTVTLTAVWKLAEYTVTFSLGEHAAQDATAPEAMAANYNAKITLPAAITAAEGYIFVGWSDGTTTHDAGASYTVNGTVTLTAVWEFAECAVTFSLGGHAAQDATAPEAMTANYNTKITLPAAITAAEGYIFVGWSDGTTTHDAGAEYTVKSSPTLTAVWNIRVTFALGEHADADATVPAAQSVAGGTAITLPTAIEPAYGYLFDGWSDGTDIYAANATYSVNSPANFTAVWKEIYSQGGLLNSNFELGDITGWTVVEGDASYAFTSNAVEYFPTDVNFFDMNGKTVQRHLQEGEHFLITNDPETVTVRSADFTLGGDGIIMFMLGVAKDPACYVAVCDSETDAELIKVTNNYWQDPETAMSLLRRVVYAGDYLGRTLYIKLVDGVKGGFGFIAFDDLMVSLTVEQARAVVAEDKDAFKNYRQDVVDYTGSMGVFAKSIVTVIRNYYAALEVINVREIYLTKTISDKAVFDDTVDITEYLSEAEAAKLGATADDFTKSIVSISDGTTTYEEGFEAFELIAGKTYTVTYRISISDSEYAESAFTITVSSNYQVLNGNFETGDLTGWTVVSGNAYISNETTYFGTDANFYDMNNATVQRYLQEGTYFLKTDEPQTVVVKSSTFTLGGDGIITFLFGIAKNPVCYVAVCDAETDAELIKVTNNYWKDPQTAMALLRRVVYAGDYIGQKLYIKIVDGAVNDFGLIAFDDLTTSLTVAEAQAIIARDKETFASYRQDVMDCTTAMGLWTKSIISVIRNYYAALEVINVRTVTITKKISDKTFYAKTDDITAYLSEIQATMLGVAADEFTKSIVSISDGETDYTEGFAEFELIAGKTYTVTYRVSEENGEYAEETFTITILTNNQILNGDFETGDLTGWTDVTGNVNTANALSSADYIESWIQHMPYNKSGDYFLNNAGLGEHAKWELKSNNFVLGGKGYISFKIASQNSFIKVFKADGRQIYSYTCHTFHETAEAFPHYELGGNWITMRTHYADLSEYIGEELYIVIGNKGESNVVWEYGYFDDIITYYDEDFDFTGKQDEVVLTCLDNRVQHSDGETFRTDWIKAENEYVAPATEEKTL